MVFTLKCIQMSHLDSMNWQSRVWTKFGGVTEDPDLLLVCGVI